MKDNIVHIFAENEMKDEASAWLAKVDRGLTSEEEPALKTWLGQSTAHREYFVKLAKQWDLLSVLSQLADIVPYNKPKTSYNFKHYLIAASVTLLVIFNMPLLTIGNFFSNDNVALNSSTSKTLFTKTYQTVVGEKSIVHLPDSSILTLNTDSIVEVKYTSNKRELLLKKGELFIDVAHNKKRELVVTAGEKSFVAVGTAFNVSYLEKSSLELIVTEGKVVITNKSDVVNRDHFAEYKTKGNIKPPMGVIAGEKVVLESNGKLLTKNIRKTNIMSSIDSSLSWREGKLIFKGETLDKVIAEVSRYSNIKIDLEGEEIKKVKIGGRFRTGDVDGLLNILIEHFDIETSRTSESSITLHLVKTNKSA